MVRVQFAWINFDAFHLVQDFQILPAFCTEHNMIILTLENYAYRTYSKYKGHETRSTDPPRNKKLVWNQNNCSNFMQNLNKSQYLYFNSNCPNQLNDNLIRALKVAAEESNLVHLRSDTNLPKINSKPWFNKECYLMKQNLKRKLKACKKCNFSGEDVVKEFLDGKKAYNKELKNCKNEYYNNLTKNISNTKNNVEFWKAVNTFRRPKNKSNDIPPQKWLNYLNSVFPAKDNSTQNFYDARHPFLDSDITMEEVTSSIEVCKNGKAPGPDGIPNEFYKNLTPARIHYLQNLFNTILREEKLPDPWSNIYNTKKVTRQILKTTGRLPY